MKAPSGWRWVPSLYLFQGVPYSIVMTTSALFYKGMGVSATSFAFWTGLLYLPWTIKPLWSPLVEANFTKRGWIVATQIVVALAFALLGLTFGLTSFFVTSLIILGLIAFASASHDIACDGFYMLALEPQKQSFFVGIRSMFYRVAMLSALGLMPQVVGTVEDSTGDTPLAWSVAFLALAATMLALALYNAFALPRPSDNTSADNASSLHVLVSVLKSFFSKPGAAPAVAFLLLYRLGEAQLAKIATPFLIDTREMGGLSLSTSQYGLIYGTAGMVALTAGGILGGWTAARYGLKRVIWWMVALMNLPNLIYVALAIWQPAADSWSIYAAIVTEQAGYGFGFTAYMLFLLQYVGESKYKTAEYALGTTFMALGMMLPGMLSGLISDALGYKLFFIYVVLCCIPGTILTAYLPLPKTNNQNS